ncbi:protein-L-isoaspartate(D-aspartate) O-methyltransferase [Anaeromyxobacter dehalogenans]|uniref:Protein-L-isoaspartate O-methyltransferase n=1 Tax=Anaeromyxobacter dehalogenans (strain 2CP-C) TaxID=290397 RepID=PIMT_ANADE|nr:protein-L-isoaspartate(D-aspartate) O-methyltransferase [Anaeromyxobacter dehalogenans]Q2IIL9.1 RecName: Full=Protein-L-isoaspartate O-methyltransferase; AltName: Full=L-isoaspartyl protein carboxyl methyltransferase; AltName: Full=Protein L-isoaspartyl methyltransferase; AltName: Full=Protein-beta-aspartate methyltransferase; Short=PIMT [Anaeromyxobacter dehalogenans 2CP-C]ABC81499.1 protein-L-isoaspartate O-methyltransferase [Anaeromyxobacter dehalogenans 2CP-C]
MSRELAEWLGHMGIRDRRVLDAIAELDRARFVPPHLVAEAYADRPLPIGFGQTISQPFVVAFMTEALGLDGGERVLEVGTGSGYQTALLARLAGEVWSVEIVPGLAARARALLLGDLGLANVHLREGDGALGWPEAAPFDRILVTAAAPQVPPPLRAQLAPGGRMVLPVGEAESEQVLRVLERAADGIEEIEDLLPVRFVPLTHLPPAV